MSLISIIIPAKNEQNNIELCLQSLNDVIKEGVETEIIVIDNGSNDKTVEIAHSCGAVVEQLPFGTISELRNLGARVSSGDVLAFVDADVLVDKYWLVNAIEVFRDTGAVCVGCSPELPVKSTWVEKAWHYQIYIRPYRCERSWLASMNMFVRRDAFMEIGGFNSNLFTCEDVELGYRLIEKGKIIFDKSVRAVHLGEAKNIFQLFIKESWRGIGNFDTIMRKHTNIKEVLCFVPVALYFVLYLLMIVVVLSQNLKIFAIILFVSIVMPLIKLIGLLKLPIKIKFAFQIYLIWFVYYWARGYSGFLYFINKYKEYSVNRS